MNEQHTNTWPELAMGLYERLTGANAEIAYGFENMNIQVPSGTGVDAQHASWVVNGTLRISTNDRSDLPKS